REPLCNLLKNKRAPEGAAMKNVRDILNSKPNPTTHTVPPGAMVIDALRLMSEKMVGALLVVEDGKPVGIFSERDYARKIALLDRSSKTTTVRQVMTSDLIYASPTDSMESCMELMTDKRIRHLPVMEDGRLIG